MKLFHVALGVAVVVAAAAVVAVARPSSAHGSSTQITDGITVNGTGTARAVPDQATFSFGVQTEGATAKAALAANSEKMAHVIAALKQAGIPARDIQTQNVSVMPRQNGSGQVDGFSADNSLQVLVRKVAEAGAVVDSAVAAGANNTSGPTFDQSARDAVYRSALRGALADARTKAGALAAEAHVSVGRVTRIVEGSAGAPVPMYQSAMGAAAARTPVEPGTQEVQATVTVTFAIG
ncbi:MAG: SIMPL domain-containing protein [Gaiellaceae bacterium]